MVMGGGVAGASIARALAERGVQKVTVLEKTGKFARFGGPIQFASNALSVLKEIDDELFDKGSYVMIRAYCTLPFTYTEDLWFDFDIHVIILFFRVSQSNDVIGDEM